MESRGKSDIYKFRVKSSTKKDDYEFHEVTNERSMDKYIVKEFTDIGCKESLKKERKILKCLSECPYITHLRCTIYNHSEYRGWIAYDFYTEPEWDTIIPSLSIDDIKSYVYQIISVLELCHREGIVHRNIGWESLFLDAKRKQIQIGGWQYALFRSDVHPFEPDVERPYFKSPERLLDEKSLNGRLRFDFAVDMWSVGCILGCMIFRKRYMFDGNDWQKIVLNIETVLGTKAMLEFVAKYDIIYNFLILPGFECIVGMDLKELITELNREVATNEAIDLLKNLIVIDPEHRFKASEALNHSFFNSFEAPADHAQRQTEISTVYKYKIANKAGSGLFSDVYKILEASKTENDKVRTVFAAKHLLKSYPEHPEKEIKILEYLRGCPYVIQIHGALKDDSFKYACIFMEYFEGDKLDEYNFRGIEELRFYLHQLLIALRACHSRGIMHRDLKPANVLINYRKEQLRLIDFGLAEFHCEGMRHNCGPGAFRYKAPELFLGYECYDYAVDMWAFGVIFACCVFKKNIFGQSKSMISQIMRILGTSELLNYIAKLGNKLNLRCQLPSTNYPILPWRSFVDDSNRCLATDEALDLIDQLLVYDHERRLKVEETLRHAFFFPYFTRS